MTTKLRAIVSPDEPVLEDVDFATECHRQLDKLLAKGITALVLVGDMSDTATKPPLVRAVPDSYAVQFGLIKLANHELVDLND